MRMYKQDCEEGAREESSFEAKSAPSQRGRDSRICRVSTRCGREVRRARMQVQIVPLLLRVRRVIELLECC
jgi:hypothetical protein